MVPQSGWFLAKSGELCFANIFSVTVARSVEASEWYALKHLVPPVGREGGRLWRVKLKKRTFGNLTDSGTVTQ